MLHERGSPPVDPAAVLGWGASALRDTAGIDELDDMIVTGRASYHLVRCATSADGAPVLVYVCLERSRANLALARRALAGLSFAAPPTSQAPPSPVHPLSPHPARTPISAAQIAVPPAPRAEGDPLRGPDRPAGAAPPRPERQALPERAPATAAGGPAPPQPVPAPRPPSALPLPRRTPAPVRPADPGPPQPSPVGARWAHDTGTMRRLLAGLRALK